jgi:hypothetical protein
MGSGLPMSQNQLGAGVRRPRSTLLILGKARTQSTHMSTIPYIEIQVIVFFAKQNSSNSYYKLGLRFKFTKG